VRKKIVDRFFENRRLNRHYKLKSTSGYVRKNGCERLNSNPCPHQPETYSGIEIAAILKRRTAHSATAARCWFKHVNNKNANPFVTAIRVIFDWHFCVLLTTVTVESISSEAFHIVEPKATCHVTRQASINARASVRFLI